jgi:hypothetical protein
VPEAYGFKSVKWISHVVLTNLFHANDTYAEWNNNIESWLKSFAATLSIPRNVKAGERFPVTGYAQVGLSGIARVQVSIRTDPPPEKPEEWIDAEILPPPKNWGDLPDGKIIEGTRGFDRDGRPTQWPMRMGKVFWAALLPGLSSGEYVFRCRTVDDQGNAQPQPRPFKNSGHCAIETKSVTVA